SSWLHYTQRLSQHQSFVCWHHRRMGKFARLVVLVAAAGCGDDQPTEGPGFVDAPGGGGGSGIAAQYPNDVGIGGDSRVIFADDFESYASGADLDTRWDAVYNMTGITTTAAHVYAGSKALEFTA